MKKFKLVVGRPLPFEPNVVDRITIDETQSRVNELMGISDIDFVRMNSKRAPEESAEGIDDAVLRVAKQMGVSLEDVRKYGHEGYKGPSSESEMKLTGKEDQDINDAVLQAAKLMDVDPEDIKRYGYK